MLSTSVVLGVKKRCSWGYVWGKCGRDLSGFVQADSFGVNIYVAFPQIAEIMLAIL